MSIAIHTVEVSEATESGKSVQRVVAGTGNSPANASGNPTVPAYLIAEAGNSYLPVLVTSGIVVTVSATDANAA